LQIVVKKWLSLFQIKTIYNYEITITKEPFCKKTHASHYDDMVHVAFGVQSDLWGQVWTYDFGTSTGTITSGASTAFFLLHLVEAGRIV
jgi:hypothetical protein